MQKKINKKIKKSVINENVFLCSIHAHIHKNYIYDGFIQNPTLWETFWYSHFLLSFIT